MHSSLEYRLRRFRRGLFARLALFFPAFHRLIPAGSSLDQMRYAGEKNSKKLIIFLPGIGDLAEDFERRGFISEMRRHNVVADAIAIDAHYGYYASRVIHQRMTEDVIDLACSVGYEQIWLVGISLGGFGAASYAARHQSSVAGLILLAPYLGGTGLVNEISAAGGIEHWTPGKLEHGDYQRALWAWLKNHFFTNNDSRLPIYLGYGERDMFRHANRLLANALPKEKVFAIPGGHDWRTWKKIWKMILEQWDH
jgi:pimeloyl-ACP methyl ester carboxylesterase